MSITMIGLDTAKSVFQIHGVNETGKVEIKRKVRRSELIAFFEKQESLHGRDGGLWRRASLGAHADRPWAHGEADRPRSGQTLREEGQEERCRPMPRRSAKPPRGPT